MYKNASKKGYRFASIKGQLSVEQLWVVPLSSSTGFSLNDIAKQIYKELQEYSTNSIDFVGNSKCSTQEQDLKEMLEIVKDVITDKANQLSLKQSKAIAQAKKDKLTEVLARKQDQSIEAMSVEEITALINSL